MFESIAMGKDHPQDLKACFPTLLKINSSQAARPRSSMQAHLFGVSIGALYIQMIEQVKNLIAQPIHCDSNLLSRSQVVQAVPCCRSVPIPVSFARYRYTRAEASPCLHTDLVLGFS